MKKMVLIALVVVMLAVLMVGCQTASSSNSDAVLIKMLQEENAKLKERISELEAEVDSLPAYKVGEVDDGYISIVMGSSEFSEADLLKIATIESSKISKFKCVFFYRPGAKRVKFSAGEYGYQHSDHVGTYEMQDGKMVKDD